ncbi:MAG: SapC family protein [Desulfobacteraceae bacterium]|nr:SapC family protein [Desulfobacteraceae bacterium]
MFKKIEALSADAHQDLRFTPDNSYGFATEILNAPIGASEFQLAAQYYPIIFPVEGSSPLALLTLNTKTNLFINNDGSWKVPYVPAHIRRYPFILANNEKETSKENFVVCIDIEAPHFSDDQGDPMFTADGTPADITQNAINFLKQFQNEMQATQAACRELEEQNVLVERRITLEKDGNKSSVGGFRCVDMEKLNKLDDAVLAKWVRNGLMGLIYTHVRSLANVKSMA